MAIHYRTQGFIFKKRDTGEADRLFTIYTKDFGKLEILAKAERKIKSKLRAGLELFYLSEIEFIQGKIHKTLTDAILINNFKNLRKDLKRLQIAYKISETFDGLIKGEGSDEQIWNLINEAFNELNSLEIKNWTPPSHCPLEIIYYYFLWNLISFLGYQPELYNCSLCQKKLTPENIFFNSKEGGLICNQCKKSTKADKQIESDIVKIIRIFLKKDWPTLKRLKIEDKDLKQLAGISNFYLAEILRQVE